MSILYNLFTSPPYANLEFKYFDKSYYVNREIIQNLSEYVSKNPELTTIYLPMIKGPIEKIFNYLLGNHICIEKEDAFFYVLMSQFLELKDRKIELTAQSLLPNNLTLEMVDQFFKSQTEIHYNPDIYYPYFKYLKNYFAKIKDPYISYYAVSLALDKYSLLDLDLKSNEKILQCLLQDLKKAEYQDDKYIKIEKTIINLIEKCPDMKLFRMILSCPYFDIRKIAKFNELISQSFDEEKYPNESGEGYFKSHIQDGQIKDCLLHSIPECSSLDDFLRIYNKERPTIFFDFNSFTFDIQSYSLQTDLEYPYPVSWSLYASSDLVNYTEIHNCENSQVFDNNDNEVNFKVDKIFPFARSIKFVLFKSSDSSSTNLSSLALKSFDIFGTLHKSFPYKSLTYNSSQGESDEQSTDTNTSDDSDTNLDDVDRQIRELLRALEAL